MFESWILVCSVVVPELCTELRDTEGPYPTEKECVLRNDEMAKFVYERQVFAVEIKSRCKLVSEENDESTTPDTEEEGIESPAGTILRTSI
jgi:hypothetical protein